MFLFFLYVLCFIKYTRMNNKTHRTERWFTYTATNTSTQNYDDNKLLKILKITCLTDCNKPQTCAEDKQESLANAR